MFQTSPHSRWLRALAMLACWLPLQAHAVSADRDDLHDRVAACAACHGEAGRSAAEDYYPSIAGKPAAYLYAQLTHFRDGRRPHAIMASMLAWLSDAYLREIAAYYAPQDAATTPRSGSAPAATLEQGRRLVVDGDPARELPPCGACHGESLLGFSVDGSDAAVPGLLGLPPEYLAAQIGAWQTGVRHAAAPDCMLQIARKLDATEVGAVTAWIASRPLPAEHRPERLPVAPTTLPLACGSIPEAAR